MTAPGSLGVLQHSRDLLSSQRPQAEVYVREIGLSDTVVSGLMGLVAAEVLIFLTFHGTAAVILAFAALAVTPLAAWALAGPRALWLSGGMLTSLSVWERLEVDLASVDLVARERGLRIDPLRFRGRGGVLSIHNLSDETEELRLAVGRWLDANNRQRVADERARPLLGLSSG